MVNLMRQLHERTGKRVVVLVDEYDNFILHSLGDREKVAQARQRFQNVFGPLKAEGIYVMELKYDDTADAALDQINRRGYADKYALDGRPIIKVGIAFSSEERNITDWKIAKE